MSEPDPETLLEWLNSGHGEDRDMQLIALEQLCMILLMSDNTDQCFELYPPRNFLTPLCNIFLDETVSHNILEVAARAITYFLNISAECSRRIVSIDGFIKSLCEKILCKDISNKTSLDLSEQCVKVLELLCSREALYVYKSGGLLSITMFLSELGNVVHKDIKISSLNILIKLFNKIEYKDSQLPFYIESLQKLLSEVDIETHEKVLKCFLSLSGRFTKQGYDLNTVFSKVIINNIYMKLEKFLSIILDNYKSKNPLTSTLQQYSNVVVVPSSQQINLIEITVPIHDIKKNVNIIIIYLSLLTNFCISSMNIMQCLLSKGLLNLARKSLKLEEKLVYEIFRLFHIIITIILEGPKQLHQNFTDFHPDQESTSYENLKSSFNSSAVLNLLSLKKTCSSILKQSNQDKSGATGTKNFFEYLYRNKENDHLFEILGRCLGNNSFHDDKPTSSYASAIKKSSENMDRNSQIKSVVAKERKQDDEMEDEPTTSNRTESSAPKKSESMVDTNLQNTEMNVDLCQKHLHHMYVILVESFLDLNTYILRKTFIGLLFKITYILNKSQKFTLQQLFCNINAQYPFFLTRFCSVIYAILNHEGENECKELMLDIIEIMLKEDKKMFLLQLFRIGIFELLSNYGYQESDSEDIKKTAMRCQSIWEKYREDLGHLDKTNINNLQHVATLMDEAYQQQIKLLIMDEYKDWSHSLFKAFKYLSCILTDHHVKHENMSVTPYEMVSSGLLETLLKVLSPQTDNEMDKFAAWQAYERIEIFFKVFKYPTSQKNLVRCPLAILIRKIVEAFDYIENFPQYLHNYPSFDNYSGSFSANNMQLLLKKLRFSLKRHPDEKLLVDKTGKVLRVEPLVQISSLRHFIYQKVSKQWYEYPRSNYEFVKLYKSLVSKPVDFIFESFDDENGVIYWLGTNAKNWKDWINPLTHGIIGIKVKNLEGEGKQNNNFNYLIMRENRKCNVTPTSTTETANVNDENSILSIEIDMGLYISPTAVTFNLTKINENCGVSLFVSNNYLDWYELSFHVEKLDLKIIFWITFENENLPKSFNERGWRYLKMQSSETPLNFMNVFAPDMATDEKVDRKNTLSASEDIPGTSDSYFSVPNSPTERSILDNHLVNGCAYLPIAGQFEIYGTVYNVIENIGGSFFETNQLTNAINKLKRKLNKPIVERNAKAPSPPKFEDCCESKIPVGTRVTRGPDWKWLSQDGGTGAFGTILSPIKDGWVNVYWEKTGITNTYRIGAEGNKIDVQPILPMGEHENVPPPLTNSDKTNEEFIRNILVSPSRSLPPINTSIESDHIYYQSTPPQSAHSRLENPMGRTPSSSQPIPPPPPPPQHFIFPNDDGINTTGIINTTNMFPSLKSSSFVGFTESKLTSLGSSSRFQGVVNVGASSLAFKASNASNRYFSDFYIDSTATTIPSSSSLKSNNTKYQLAHKGLTSSCGVKSFKPLNKLLEEVPVPAVIDGDYSSPTCQALSTTSLITTAHTPVVPACSQRSVSNSENNLEAMNTADTSMPELTLFGDEHQIPQHNRKCSSTSNLLDVHSTPASGCTSNCLRNINYTHKQFLESTEYIDSNNSLELINAMESMETSSSNNNVYCGSGSCNANKTLYNNATTTAHSHQAPPYNYNDEDSIQSTNLTLGTTMTTPSRNTKKVFSSNSSFFGTPSPFRPTSYRREGSFNSSIEDYEPSFADTNQSCFSLERLSTINEDTANKINPNVSFDDKCLDGTSKDNSPMTRNKIFLNRNLMSSSSVSVQSNKSIKPTKRFEEPLSSAQSYPDLIIGSTVGKNITEDVLSLFTSEESIDINALTTPKPYSSQETPESFIKRVTCLPSEISPKKRMEDKTLPSTQQHGIIGGSNNKYVKINLDLNQNYYETTQPTPDASMIHHSSSTHASRNKSNSNYYFTEDPEPTLLSSQGGEKGVGNVEDNKKIGGKTGYVSSIISEYQNKTKTNLKNNSTSALSMTSTDIGGARYRPDVFSCNVALDTGKSSESLILAASNASLGSSGIKPFKSSLKNQSSKKNTSSRSAGITTTGSGGRAFSLSHLLSASSFIDPNNANLKNVAKKFSKNRPLAFPFTEIFDDDNMLMDETSQDLRDTLEEYGSDNKYDALNRFISGSLASILSSPSSGSLESCQGSIDNLNDKLMTTLLKNEKDLNSSFYDLSRPSTSSSLATKTLYLLNDAYSKRAMNTDNKSGGQNMVWYVSSSENLNTDINSVEYEDPSIPLGMDKFHARKDTWNKFLGEKSSENTKTTTSILKSGKESIAGPRYQQSLLMESEYILTRKYSSLIPAFDSRPGRTNLSQTVDIDFNTLASFEETSTKNNNNTSNNIPLKLSLKVTHGKTEYGEMDIFNGKINKNDTIFNLVQSYFIRYFTKYPQSLNERLKIIWDPATLFTLVYRQNGDEDTQHHNSPGFEDNNKNVMSSTCLNLLKILHYLIFSHYNLGYKDTVNRAMYDIESGLKKLFVSKKLSNKLIQQFHNPLALASNSLPRWCDLVVKHYHVLFPLDVRSLFLYAHRFGITRSLIWLQQRFEVNFSPNMERSRQISVKSRIKHERVKIIRTGDILKSAMMILKYHANKKSILEIEFIGEEGTGLGPSLEFYSLVANEFQKKKYGLWLCQENFAESINDTDEYVIWPTGLFPVPIDSTKINDDGGGIEDSKVASILMLFEFLGSLMAKAIQDNRLLDIPFSPAFFKLITNLKHDDHPPANQVSEKCIDLLNHIFNDMRLIENHTVQLPHNYLQGHEYLCGGEDNVESNVELANDLYYNQQAGSLLNVTLPPPLSTSSSSIVCESQNFALIDNCIEEEDIEDNSNGSITQNLDVQVSRSSNDVVTYMPEGLHHRLYYTSTKHENDDLAYELDYEIRKLKEATQSLWPASQNLDTEYSGVMGKRIVKRRDFNFAYMYSTNQDSHSHITVYGSDNYQNRSTLISSSSVDTIITDLNVDRIDMEYKLKNKHYQFKKLRKIDCSKASPLNTVGNYKFQNLDNQYKNSATGPVHSRSPSKKTCEKRWLDGVLQMNDLYDIDPDRARIMDSLRRMALIKWSILCDKFRSDEEKHEDLASLKLEIPTLIPNIDSPSYIYDENEVAYVDLSDLCLSFQYNPPSDIYHYQHLNLIPDCDNTMVNIDNIEEYLDKMTKLYLETGIEPQIRAFKAGFDKVFPLSSLSGFNSEELRLLVCGEQIPKWTLEDVIKHAHPKLGYTKSSPTFLRFANVLNGFDCAQRKAFLRFVTGTTSLPPGGLVNLKPPLTIVKKNYTDTSPSYIVESPKINKTLPPPPPTTTTITCPNHYLVDCSFPSVNTCLHYIKLPDYSSEDVLRSQLLTALKQTGFYLN